MVKILVAGDFGPRYRVGADIQKGIYTCLDELIPYTKDSDYSILNLESPLVDDPKERIPKAGPSLKSPMDSVKVLERSGFNCVTLANNHFRDYGDNGVCSTIDTLKRHGIDYVGGGHNIEEAQKILYKIIKRKKLAFVNFCENEFSIASNNHGGSAPIDVADNYYAIKEAKQQSDIVIVIIHGGHQHYSYPDLRMKKLYHYYADIGADIIINHHQHCYSGCEVYQGKPIIYGLGNFCFDHPKKRAGIWNEGYMVVLNFEESRIQYELIPYTQCDEKPGVDLMEESKLLAFWNSIHSISETISDDNLLRQQYEKFVKLRSSALLSPFTPYFNEYFQLAAGRHYLPFLIPKNKLAKMLGVIQCESHRDILIESMNDKLN